MEGGKPRGRYEITMYKLLVIFAVSIFIAIGVGGYFGSLLGFSQGIGSVEVPEYCSLQKASDGAVVRCSELENVTTSDVCQLFSTPVQKKLKIVVLP